MMTTTTAIVAPCLALLDLPRPRASLLRSPAATLAAAVSAPALEDCCCALSSKVGSAAAGEPCSALPSRTGRTGPEELDGKRERSDLSPACAVLFAARAAALAVELLRFLEVARRLAKRAANDAATARGAGATESPSLGGSFREMSACNAECGAEGGAAPRRARCRGSFAVCNSEERSPAAKAASAASATANASPSH